jgi:DNA-binding MarR family transcriptional regulator
MLAPSNREGATTMPDSPAQSLIEEIALLGALRRELSRCASPDLNPGAAGILWHLSRREPVRTGEVATALGLDQSVISRAVADLVAREYVQRVPDPVDGRACLLSVTTAGHAALAAVVTRVDQRFASRLAGWSPTELDRIAESLRQVREALSVRTAVETDIVTAS